MDSSPKHEMYSFWSDFLSSVELERRYFEKVFCPYGINGNYCLVPSVLQNIFVWVPQKNKRHTGLEWQTFPACLSFFCGTQTKIF